MTTEATIIPTKTIKNSVEKKQGTIIPATKIPPQSKEDKVILIAVFSFSLESITNSSLHLLLRPP
jgi:hypothetical protein